MPPFLARSGWGRARTFPTRRGGRAAAAAAAARDPHFLPHFAVHLLLKALVGRSLLEQTLGTKDSSTFFTYPA